MLLSSKPQEVTTSFTSSYTEIKGKGKHNVKTSRLREIVFSSRH